MNSACAVIAGDKIGSVPYLMKHEQNGLIFRDKDINDLTRKTLYLLKNPERISQLGREAYKTISNEWNAETAAKRFVTLSEALKEDSKPVNLFDDGPCSIAPVL